MSTFRRVAPLLLLTAALWAGVQLLQVLRQEQRWREVAQAAVPGDIVMLSSQTCPYCEQARLQLGERRVPFRECFLERDADCAAPGTPTFSVRGRRIVGFDLERLAQALSRG
jgi:glutaredoxin